MNLSWGADPPLGGPTGRGSGAGLRPASVVPGPDRPARAAGDPAPVRPAGAALHHRLADELAPMVRVWERLLATHQPDRSGRCRTCTQGGTGLPGTQWPCALHGLADLARRRHDLAEGA
jgi:hypothetical protein